MPDFDNWDEPKDRHAVVAQHFARLNLGTKPPAQPMAQPTSPLAMRIAESNRRFMAWCETEDGKAARLRDLGYGMEAERDGKTSRN